MKTLLTQWGETLERNAPLPEYPRPQLVRESYLNLNGTWHYTVLHDGLTRHSGTITVPFSPEAPLSGCDFQLRKGETLHYTRRFTLPHGFVRDRVLLHFGAVDQYCTVYINGRRIGAHGGGYLPFCFDITDALRNGENDIAVEVTDDIDGGIYAYGKQKYDRGGIWYTAQSGIWQTVWMESVPDNHIAHIGIEPDFDAHTVRFTVDAERPDGANIVIRCGDTVIAEEWTDGQQATCLIQSEYFHPWSPEEPFLYTATIALGEDRVETYFGMRKFSTKIWDGKCVLCLNNKPYFQSGLLDQGYWSDGLYTAPSDEAMVHDIQTMKSMGFNMLRKHIKIEPLRWYYHCDRLGMLVWQDAVSGGTPFLPLYTQVLPFLGCNLSDKPSRRFGREDENGRMQFERDLFAMMDLLNNCVSLCLWTPFNEGWGQFDAARIAEAVQKKDPTRWVDHASGWHDRGAGDLRSYHIYYRPLRMRHDSKRALALTEFGGYSLPVAGHCATQRKFGYRAYHDAQSLLQAWEKLYEKQLLPLVKTQKLSAAVYTQLSDVEDELNGLLTYDRRVCKLDASRVRAWNEKLRASL